MRSPPPLRITNWELNRQKFSFPEIYRTKNLKISKIQEKSPHDPTKGNFNRRTELEGVTITVGSPAFKFPAEAQLSDDFRRRNQGAGRITARDGGETAESGGGRRARGWGGSRVSLV